MAKSSKQLNLFEDLEEDQEESTHEDESKELAQELDLPEEETDPQIIELEDGSAIVNYRKGKGPNEDPDHFANLAEEFEDDVLKGLATKFIDLIEIDMEARSERDRQYEDGLRRTGLGEDAPGGNPALGGNKITSPLLTDAVISFASVAIKELTPPGEIVRTDIKGRKLEKKVVDQAERKADFLNWQLNTQISEYRSEKEQEITQLPLGGSQFMKLWFDKDLKRPRCEWVPVDRIILPFSCASFYTASRVTELEDITYDDLLVRIDQGQYRALDQLDDDWNHESSSSTPTNEGEQTRTQDAADKIEGKESPIRNVDSVRRIYHVQAWLRIEEDKVSKGKRAPYILTIDDEFQDLFCLYRNWASGDETMAKLDWFVEDKFLPFRGALGLSLEQLMGGLSATATGSLRALLDAAYNANSQTMVMLKSGVTGQTLNIEPNQITEIENSTADDVRKVLMPVPFAPPNPVLFELLNWVTTAAKQLVQTTVDETPETGGANTPVGTTMARIESGMKTFSSIHARMHRAQQKFLEILCRINYWHLEEMDNLSGVEVEVRDFATSSLVQPVSDPNIFSELQRISQAQAVLQLAQTAKDPKMYNERELHKQVLRAMKIPYIDEVLPDEEGEAESSAVLENISMSMGRMVSVAVSNEHVAHLLTHLSFASDPNYGANPLIAPTYAPLLLEHIKQHLTLHYLSSMQDAVKRDDEQGEDLFELHKEGRVLSYMEQQAIAMTALKVAANNKPVLAEFLPIIAGIQKKVSEMSKAKQESALMADPTAGVLLKTTQDELKAKAAKDQADNQLAAQAAKQKYELEISKLETKIAELETGKDNDDKIDDNKNATAIAISAMNNESRERVEELKLNVQASADQAQLEHERAMAAITATIGAQQQLQTHGLDIEKSNQEYQRQTQQNQLANQNEQAATAQQQLVDLEKQQLAQPPALPADQSSPVPPPMAAGGLAQQAIEQKLGSGGSLPKAALIHQMMEQQNKPKPKE